MRRVAPLALAATFVIALFGGTAVSYARMAADRFPSPSWRVSTWRWYPTRFEGALSDHLAGREALLGWHARFKLHTLRTSPTPRVWLGSDGWLFYNHWADMGATNTPAHLQRVIETWDTVVRARRDWCEARGIQLLMVVVPDKQAVYPERLPAVVRVRHDEHAFDHTQERWRAEPAVPFLDLRPELVASKEYGSVYYRNDTHWTPMGSYVGGAAIVERLSDVLPGGPPPSWLAVHHVLQRRNLGDLWRMAGMRPSPPEEPVLVPTRSDNPARRTNEVVPVPDVERLSHLKPVVWKGGTGPRAVLFHDSFADWDFQSVIAERCDR